jgi:hypothetical protein
MATPLVAPFMTLGTKDGNVDIREADLSSVTDAELRRLRITRDELCRCFAEAMEMMRGATPADWAKARPIAEEIRDGEWIVVGPVGYNQYTHPLMRGPASGEA